MRYLGPQDDIAALIVCHSRHTHAGQARIGQHSAVAALDIYQIGKINIPVPGQNRAGLNINFGGPQHNTAAGIDLALDFNLRVIIKLQAGRLEVSFFMFLVVCRIPRPEIGKVILNCIVQISVIVPRSIK